MKVSVPIITYNHERFIGQAIESVLAQEVKFEYEIVIGEDCSTDRTRDVILEFQRRYPDRIKPLLRDRNVGAMRNVEGTIAACRGEYLAFLEGDDYWTPRDKLQKQIDFLDAHDDRSMCCARARYVYEQGTENCDIRCDVWPSVPAGPYTIENILTDNFVPTCTAVLRRDLIPPFPRWFFKMKLGDWPLWAMVAQNGKIELMDEVMATYRVHRDASWSSQSWPLRLGWTARMFRALDKELGYRHTSIIRGYIASRYLDLAITARSNGKRLETAKYIVGYIRNGGWRLPGSARVIGGMMVYEMIGSRYKVLSRVKSPKVKLT